MALGEELRDAALAAIRSSWRVFPCKYGSKVPAIRDWPNKATWDERQLSEWWDGVKLYNLSVLTGYPGPDVLDVDVRPDGDGWASYNLLREAGLLAGAWRMVRTPSGGGLHLYFAGSEQRSGAIKEQFLDFKAKGGCAMLPPSSTWGRYEVIEERPQTGVRFNWAAAKQLLCPAPAYRPLRQRSSRQLSNGQRGGALVGWLEDQFEGNRNDGLFWACCRAVEVGADEIIDELADVARSAGLSESEIRSTVESAYRAYGNGR